MIHDLVLPQLAMGMSEGSVVEWAVAEGALVERDATLAAIETEKVVVDLPSPYRGWVHQVARLDDKLPVDVLIAQVADTEDEYRQLVAGSAAKQAAALAPALTVAAPDPATPATPATAAALPTAAAVAAPTALAASPTAAAVASHPSPAPVAARPFDAPVAAAGRIKASGLARKMAADQGIDLTRLRGSGPEGRIVKRDLLQASAIAAAAPAGVVPAADGVRARVPMTGMRRTIADRMVTAKTTAAHTYAFFEIDLTKLAAARDTLLAREKEFGGRISMLAFYAKALALACRHVPICNATLIGDEIIVWDPVHIGIAVALPGKTEFESGLLVPVLRHAERKGLQEIDREIKDLVDRARNNRLTSADMAGGTVTLSSIGGFLSGQWCVSTPLLNQPQVLNFQPGTPLKKPVVVGDDQIAVRQMLPCGLSFDHRAMDGEPIGRFVRKLSDLLTHPELMLA